MACVVSGTVSKVPFGQWQRVWDDPQQPSPAMLRICSATLKQSVEGADILGILAAVKVILFRGFGRPVVPF